MALNRSLKDQKFITTYLNFLGVAEQTPSLSFLTELVLAHLKKVAFDASDFALRQPEKCTLKKKAILEQFLQGNGGICYQMHGLLKKLLTLLGFQTVLSSARVFRYGNNLRPAEQDSHCVLITSIHNKEFIVDLAWGNPMRAPLPVGGEVSQIAGEFPHRCIVENDEYQEQVLIDGVWQKEYAFRKIDVKLKSFSPGLFYLSSPGIHTAESVLLMRFDENGEFEFTRKFLYKDHHTKFSFFRTTAKGEEVEVRLSKQADVDDRLKKFGVDEGNRERIWKICSGQ